MYSRSILSANRCYKEDELGDHDIVIQLHVDSDCHKP